MILNCIFFVLKVKAIEKRDSSLTPVQQIDRLTRPGATYFNLNPYDVCQCFYNMVVNIKYYIFFYLLYYIYFYILKY